MKSIRPYIEATRWRINLFAVLLVIVSVKYAGGDLSASVLPAVAVFVVLCATMVQNDLRDRQHDARMGKRHAAQNPRQYRLYATTLWLLSGLLAMAVWLDLGWQSGALIFLCIVTGLLYSELLTVPVLPNLLVAGASSLTVLLATLGQGNEDSGVLLLFVAVASVIHGREILKDFEDHPHDIGHKWTWIQAVGETGAKRVAALSLAVACLATWLVLLQALGWVRLVALLWVPTVVQLAVRGSMSAKEASRIKSRVDVVMALVLAALLFV